MNRELYIVIGAFGSGKSEYAIHLSRSLKDAGKDVVLADMDVVNPYFRSRDVRDEFAALGIEVIAPDGEFKHADLPMISPRIKGAIENYAKTVVLDVGGDPAGCRTLGRFVDAVSARGYEMHFVVNTRRPFTGTVEEVIAMQTMLEFSAKLKITHLICNSNLMQFTDASVVEEGISILKEVAALSGLIFTSYLALRDYADKVPDGLGGLKRILMEYTLQKPWERLHMQGI